MSTNTLFFSLSALLVFLFFSLPIIFDWKENYSLSYKSLPIYTATGSIEFKISVYCSIAVSLPMLLELVLRLLSNPSTIFVYKTVISNFVLMFSLLIPDITLLTYVIPHLDLVALNIVINGRIVLLLWITSSFLSMYGGPIFKLRITKYWYIILLAQRLVDFYGIYSSNCSPALAAPLGVLGVTIFYYQAFLWFREFSKLAKLQKLTTDHCLSNIYVISCCMTMLGILSVFIGKKFQYWIYFSSADLAAFTYVDTIFYVLLFALQGNALQREATASQNMLSVKRIFFRYMSHEIRTPLNTVMMGLQFLEEDMVKRGDSSVRLQTLADVRESCDIAIKTLNDMLIYDKIETGGLVLDKGTVDIVDLVESTIRPFQLQASQSHVSLCIHKTIDESEVTGPLLVSADTSKMAQVIRNITSNALKFTPGGGSVTVSLSLEQQEQQEPLSTAPATSPRSAGVSVLADTLTAAGGVPGGGGVQRYIRIDVTDTGHGISEENQGKLFQGIIQFSPGKLQNGGGSGLGLYISKGIVDGHGGYLSVHSQGEGRGCTFTVTLPLLNAFPAAPPSLAPSWKYQLLPHTTGRRSATSLTALPASPLPAASDPKYGLTAYLQQTALSFPLMSTRINIRQNTALVVQPDKPGSGGENVCFDKVRRLRSHSEEKISGSFSESEPEGGVIEEKKPAMNCLGKNPTITTSSLGGVGGPHNHRFSDCSVKSFCSDDVTENEHSIVTEGEKYLQRKKAEDSCLLSFNRGKSAEGGCGGGGGGTSSSSKQTLAAPSSKYRYRLLVVDDVAMNRRMMIRLLGDRCSLVREAANGLEAVHLVREAARTGTPFDVITMDYQMPVMDGPTATRQIRELGYRGIILGLTGNVLPSDMAVFLSHGVNRVLVKPLDIKAFDMTILELSASVSRHASSVNTY